MDITGAFALSNPSGIDIDGSRGNTIGGTAAGEGNVISGNSQRGVALYNGTMSDLIMGNRIGTGADGLTPIGNGTAGVWLADASSNSIGGTVAGSSNIIANTSAGNGVTVSGASTGDAILGNSIYNNSGLGIDLGNDGVTINDPNDPDSGPNGLQNTPEITVVKTDGAQVTINGFLNSIPSRNYRIEFFANSTQSTSGYGEGARYLGSTNVTTTARVM